MKDPKEIYEKLIKDSDLLLKDSESVTEQDKELLVELKHLLNLKAKQAIYEYEIYRSEDLRNLRKNITLTTDQYKEEKVTVEEEIKASSILIDSKRLKVLDSSIKTLEILSNKTDDDYVIENISLKREIEETETKIINKLATSLQSSYGVSKRFFNSPILTNQSKNNYENNYKLNEEVVENLYKVLGNYPLLNELIETIKISHKINKTEEDKEFSAEKIEFLKVLNENYDTITSYLENKEELHKMDDCPKSKIVILSKQIDSLKSDIDNLQKSIFSGTKRVKKQIDSKYKEKFELENQKNQLENEELIRKKMIEEDQKRLRSKLANYDLLKIVDNEEIIEILYKNKKFINKEKIIRRIKKEISRYESKSIRINNLQEEYDKKYETLSSETKELLEDEETSENIFDLFRENKSNKISPYVSVVVLNLIRQSNINLGADLILDEFHLNEELLEERYSEEVSQYVDLLETQKDDVVFEKDKVMQKVNLTH